MRRLPTHCPESLATVAIALLASAALEAQTTRGDPVDLQARFGLGANVNLPKKFESTFGYELRMVDDAKEYRGSYLSAEVVRAFGKRLSLLTNYRLAQVTDATAHRFGLGAQLEQQVKKSTTFSLRPMLQYQPQRVDDDGETIDETTFLRARARAKYDARKRLALYGSVEPHFTFTGDFPVDNWRNVVGAQWEFMKNRKFDLHYIYRPDYSKVYNRTFHVLGAELSFDTRFPR